MDDALLYRSIYQYNDAMAPESGPEGLSYAEITDKYFQTQLSKDSMTGSAASSSVASSSSSVDSQSNLPARYDSDIAYLSHDASTLVSSGPVKPPPTSQSSTSSNPSTVSSYDDPHATSASSYSQSTLKTLAQLNKKTLGTDYETGSAYGDGYTYGASYSDASSVVGSGQAKNVNGTTYYETVDDGSSYETPAPLKDGKKTSNNGYEVSGPNGTGYSSYPDMSSYETPTSRPQSGNYGDVQLSGESGKGFGGLNQTQIRLMAAVRAQPGSMPVIETPLYAESQKTDFFKSFSWNERWQALLERPTMTPEEIKQRGDDINQLTEEFLHVARPIVTRIVEELHLPDEEKTFKPVDVGGVAGGEKFIAKQLFLKYARDNIKLRLYNGDAWAQKAAIHELKSLNALIGCNIPNLHFPLMACLSCYGHYIVVVSKLPLSKKHTRLWFGQRRSNHYDQSRSWHPF